MYVVKVLLMLLACVMTHQVYAKRVALIIGNADYQYETKLKNATNDAKLLAKTFQELKFDEVQLIENATIQQLGRKVDDFKQLAQGAEIAVVYFAGHGQQTEDKQNYLLATDAKIEHVSDLKYHALRSDDLMYATEGAKTRLVILDACRDRPGTALTRNLTKGLSRARDPSGQGLLVAYAAEDGQVAQDGTFGGNSPYAIALSQELKKTDKPILAMLDDVADQVAQTTNLAQRPTRSGNLRVDAYLVANQTIHLNVTTPQFDADTLFWNNIKNSTQVAEYQAYLTQYPQGHFKALAEARIKLYEQKKIAVSQEESLSEDELLLQQGMWRDPKTKLIWMRCSLGQVWNGKSCTSDPKIYNWRDAKTEIMKFNRDGGLGGYSDWELPHIYELETLRYCSDGAKGTDKVPSSKSKDKVTIVAECKGRKFIKPTIDKKIFLFTPAYAYWTNTENYRDFAWFVNFAEGSVGSTQRIHEMYIRLVRREQ